MTGRILVALLFCLVALAPARAADIKSLDLGKNVEVWFSEDHTVPIIAFSITLPGGSAYDPAGKAGLGRIRRRPDGRRRGQYERTRFSGRLGQSCHPPECRRGTR